MNWEVNEGGSVSMELSSAMKNQRVFQKNAETNSSTKRQITCPSKITNKDQ